MQHIFSTLFDKNYLSRGIALYESLLTYCPNFHLYILALDEESQAYFIRNKHTCITVFSLPDIEDFYPQLSRLKQERTHQEYCWTLTSFSIQYILQKYNEQSCTYLDADICFFNNPQLIFDNIGSKSVLITEHNYTPQYDQSARSGKYCVQFMYFKNNDKGNEVLEYWRSLCEKWCYCYMEEGKFGDQKYLDDWTTRFNCIHVPTHIGCGLAPWNIQKYTVTSEQNILYAMDKITKLKQKVIFFHFHDLKEYMTSKQTRYWYLSAYYTPQNIKKEIYARYIANLNRIQNKLSVQPAIKEYEQNRSFWFFLEKALKKSIKMFVKSLLIGRQYRIIKKEHTAEQREYKEKIFFDK